MVASVLLHSMHTSWLCMVRVLLQHVPFTKVWTVTGAGFDTLLDALVQLPDRTLQCIHGFIGSLHQSRLISSVNNLRV